MKQGILSLLTFLFKFHFIAVRSIRGDRASVCQGLSSLASGGGKMRDPGNEVVPLIVEQRIKVVHYSKYGDVQEKFHF